MVTNYEGRSVISTVEDPLFTDIRIGSLHLKNRIVMPPMGTGLDAAGVMNDAAIAYYQRRAVGGVGMITVEALLVDQATRGPEPRIDDDAYIPGLRRLVDELRPADVVVGAQLLHPGRQVLSGRLVGPSSVPLNSVSPAPEELSVADINTIVEQYAQAAMRAQAAGFDFVEVHAAHGYLPSDFISPLANQRTDAYGGDIQGRARFPSEILLAIVGRCPGLPVFFRINADEGLPGGTSIDDAIVVATILEEAGVACISVSAGHWKALHITLAPMFMPRGHMVELAGRIRREVGVPIIAVGRLDRPEDARAAIQEGHADLVAIGRGLIADPDWARKAQSGRESEIRPCISCNACVDLVGSGGEVRCAVNPAVGRDDEWDLTPAATPRRVAVVGSGPAGMEAARVSRLRGHEVSLWEKAGDFGGKLIAAATAPSKSEVLRFLDYEVDLIRSIGVDMHPDVAVTPEFLIALDPDVVIIATGADPLVPPIPGIDEPYVYDAQAFLFSQVDLRVGERVVVIGGSATGCETAELLVAQGAAVTIIDMEPSVGKGIEAITRRHIVGELRRSGAEIITNAVVVSVKDRKVQYLRDDVVFELPVDRVALAVGWSSRGPELADSLDGLEVIVVGDACEPADFVAAVNAGADAGLSV